jgi:hypothetical protein
MVKTLEGTIKITLSLFSGDRLLLWDSIVREIALKCLCPTSCVELRGEIYPNVMLYTTNPTWTGLRCNSGFLVEMLTTLS